MDGGAWSGWDCKAAGDFPFPAPLDPPRVFQSQSFQHTTNGVTFQVNVSRKTKVKLFTGGSQFSTNSRLWLIVGSAAEYGPNGEGTNVPPQLIKVLGENLRDPGTNNFTGTNYYIRPDNSTLDLTPELPSNFNNYDYYVNPTPASLKLLVNGLHYPGNRVPPVKAGQRINVACELDPPIASITSYQWTILNDPISNWVATANFGGVIPLPDGYATNSSVSYYWWKAATDVQVRCDVTIEGKGMSAFARFDVNKPTASITATILNSVKVDANYEQGEMALHFGDFSGPVGIRFERTPHNLFPGWAWLQTLGSLREQRDSVSGAIRRKTVSGLDGPFPYKVPEHEFRVTDSPGMSFYNDKDKATITEQFNMFLMFKPGGDDSIYVPIARIGWRWSGYAAIQNGNWVLDSVPFPASVDQNSAETGYPQWNENYDSVPWADIP